MLTKGDMIKLFDDFRLKIITEINELIESKMKILDDNIEKQLKSINKTREAK